MFNSFRIILALFLMIPLSACIGINTVTVYQSSIAENRKSAMEGDGIAFLTGDACIYVTDRSAKISSGYDSPYKIFKVAIWIIPEINLGSNNSGYSIIPEKISLLFDDGTIATPLSVQVSGFGTTWEEQETLLGAPKESINFTDHQHQRTGVAFKEKSFILDWTRLIVQFQKTRDDMVPLQLNIQGLSRKGTKIEVTPVMFKLITESRAVFPGRWADGSSLWDSPAETCRELQQIKTP